MAAIKNKARVEMREPAVPIPPIGEGHSMDNTLRFNTETNREMNSLGIMDRMMRPDDFLNMLAGKADRREDILVDDARTLQIRWQDSQEGVSGHYYIEPDPKRFTQSDKLREWFRKHKRMPLNKLGFQTACKRINRSPKVFEKFENPHNRFLSEFHDWYRGASGRGLIVRTTSSGLKKDDGDREIEAIVPSEFNPISNYQLCASVLERIQQAHGDVLRGVQVLSSGENQSSLSYRILFGNPVLRESVSDPKKLSFVMLNFMGSEHGLGPTTMDLGLWRLICANGAMREDIDFCHCSWGRKSDERSFFESINNMINMAGIYGGSMTDKLAHLENEKLVADPFAILNALRSQNLLDAKHTESAHRNIQVHEPKTNYDMFNSLTDAAKVHGDLRKRVRAESNSLMLAMQPRSFNGVAVNGFDKTAAGGDMADIYGSDVGKALIKHSVTLN